MIIIFTVIILHVTQRHVKSSQSWYG